LLAVVGFYSIDWRYTLTDPWFAPYDAVSSVGAERVLRGAIPYRDFWTMYAPGHFYLVALLFRVFGTHLLVEVVAASAVTAAAACACYWLVVSLVGRRLAGLACAGIFVAAMYNTGYFKRLGSYPSAIFLIFVTFNLLVLYYKTGKLGWLIAGGVFTGITFVFKHDVGGYTAIAIVAGLAAHHALLRATKASEGQSLLIKLLAYAVGGAVVVLPVLIYFAVLAGPDMLQDLVVFPLTDFRFARGEHYPSLLPSDFTGETLGWTVNNVANYMKFTVPTVLFLLGVAGTVLAAIRRKPACLALGVTLSVACVLHYSAAHIQINTHIVTMSVYAAWLGLIFDEMTGRRFAFRRPALTKWLTTVLSIGWILLLLTMPAYRAYRIRRLSTVELDLPKVSGFRVAPRVADAVIGLQRYVEDHVPPEQALFVGLPRHDIVIIGDMWIYFILDRPQATRYQELHPAIADTAPVQREIIGDLETKNVSLVILRHIFTDEELDRTKVSYQKNLPQTGATDLDTFIHQNYKWVRQFDLYEVWQAP